MSKHQGVIVPINTAAVMAHVLTLAERLEAQRDAAKRGSIPWHRADEAALMARAVAVFLAQTITAAHLASQPEETRN